MSIWISIKKASEISGLDPQTLRKFADNGTIESYRTPSQQRKFNKESIMKMCNLNNDNSHKLNYIYAHTPLEDEMSARKQLAYIISSDMKYMDYVPLIDIGKTSDNLRYILDACMDKTLGEVVVAHQDRLPRLCFESLKYMIAKANGILTILSTTEHSKSEEEITRDITNIMKKYHIK